MKVNFNKKISKVSGVNVKLHHIAACVALILTTSSYSDQNYPIKQSSSATKETTSQKPQVAVNKGPSIDFDGIDDEDEEEEIVKSGVGKPSLPSSGKDKNTNSPQSQGAAKTNQSVGNTKQSSHPQEKAATGSVPIKVSDNSTGVQSPAHSPARMPVTQSPARLPSSQAPTQGHPQAPVKPSPSSPQVKAGTQQQEKLKASDALQKNTNKSQPAATTGFMTPSGGGLGSGKNSPADNIPHGKDLVSIDFPNGVSLSDIVKTIGEWTGKNFILSQGASGGTKISIISAEPVTKEEAYQAFLSALNIAGFTTVDTGSVVKVLPIANAKSANIKTYYGSNWAPATDEIINQLIPLHYIDANSVINQLRLMLGVTQYAAFTTTNSLILTDTGNRIRRILEVIKLLDSKTNQPQVTIVNINYMDAKDTAAKINDIFGSKNGPSLSVQKVLVDERTNSLILVGPAKGLDDVVRFIQRIDTPPSIDQASQAMIRVRQLDYADAEKLAQTLQALAQNSNAGKQNQQAFRPSYFPPQPQMPGVPGAPGAPQAASVAELGGVKVTADKATNSLIIQGSKSAYEELDRIITQLDKRRAQVYIEATMIDMNTQNGLIWSPSAVGGVDGGNGRYTIPFGFNSGQALAFSVTQTGATGGGAALASALQSQGALGILSNSSVTIGGVSLTPGALLFALKTDANGNVLQTPSMMVSDNQDANFQANQQYNTVATVPNPNGPGSVQQPLKYEVQTSLKVTPQISRSDYINLKINLQLDDAGSSDASSGYPNPIYKRSADSVVTVQNGQTAVLGGITQDSSKRSETKVPLLGDIPILGWLFKKVNIQKIKSSLTLFITPHVVRNSEDLEKIYQQKLKDRNEFLKFYYGEDYKNEEFYSMLPNEDAGKAPPESKQNQIDQKNKNDQSKAGNNKKVVLPSQDSNPINAPSANGSGAGFGGSGYSTPYIPSVSQPNAQQQNYAQPPPPPFQ